VEARIYSIGGRLNLSPDESNELWLDAERSRQTYSNDDNRLGTQDGTNRSGAPSPGTFNGYKDELRFNRDQIAVGHTGHYAPGTWESSVTHSTTESLGRTLPAGSAPDYGYEAQGGEDRILENRDIVVDTKFVAPVGDHIATIGGQYVDAELEDAIAGSEKFQQNSWALFAEDEWLLNDGLALTLGGRYEHHDAFGGHFSPRGYLVWNTTPEWTLKGGVSRGYKTPSLNDLHDGINGFTGQGTTVTIGSPDLEPEKSTNYEIGAIYDNQDSFSAGATLFYNRFSDRIASAADLPNCQFVDSNGDTPNAGLGNCLSIGNFTQQESFGQLTNIDKAETRGVELTASYQIAPAWRVSGGYTFTDSEITSGENEGMVLTNTPDHKLTADLTWAINERWSTTLEGEYYSSRERFSAGLPTSGESLSLYEQLGNKLNGYELFNLRSSYRFSDNVRLTGSIYNLFDKDFTSSDTFEHNGETLRAYNFTQSGRSTDGVALDGRSFWVSATYEF
jgi:outer membrane receptor for ferrienterochelin and colicins